MMKRCNEYALCKACSLEGGLRRDIDPHGLIGQPDGRPRLVAVLDLDCDKSDDDELDRCDGRSGTAGRVHER